MASLLVMLLPHLMILLIMIQIPPYLSSNDDNYTSCADTRYDCGKINNIGFPFWGGNRPKQCGHPLLQLNCDPDHDSTTYITIKNMRYRVLQAYPENQTMKIARVDYFEGLCPSKAVNTSLDFELFDYGPGNKNLTLFYHCSLNNGLSNSIPGFLNCFSNRTSDEYFYARPEALGAPPSSVVCTTSVFIPLLLQFDVKVELTWNNIEGAIQNGFLVKWIGSVAECFKCMNTGGACGYDLNSNQPTCYCKDQSGYSYLDDGHIKICDASATSPTQDDLGRSGKSTNKAAIAAGATSGAVVFVVLLIGTLFVIRRRRRNAERSRSNKDILPLSGVPLTSSTTSSSNTSQSVSSYPSSKSDSVPKSYYYGVQVFDYAELEEATNNFDPSRELGEGGFGTVYKGMLQDGRVVAVKRHYESHLKRVEQYMNEVELLAHLRHKNLVTLFGCTSRHSRELILVYEFIPNGTLADHLHGSLANSTLLTWNVRYKVALETAEALSYLHSKKVIHRDVKSTNILLTETFQVKVGDFGLSRLFPKFVTHVSTAPQGTPGYVDPEYYQNYQLTDKSDVYSFGVVLVELISSLQAVDITRNRNEVNLASLAVNRIQNQELHDMVDPCLGFEKDNDVRRMVTAVAELAFRCLQQQRDMRPSMDEVLEILRGVKGDEFGALERNSSESAVGVNHNKTEEVILLKKVLPPVSPDSVADKWQWDMLRRTS
ncbi:LEAF RUST 10 DISEASE-RESISTANCEUS RECEPTOR-LIKE PROTEIN KINASE-like 1.4 isoform X2 [Arachis hypogaea]|uniref:LEAF RUST 10 DISEASE-RESISTANCEUS RECEPTOR-LIKE PROTEIN KINASE-like 1.4 isoform X2 n=1 Tax=Arachis hypogaea TaxID=3818 RepID=UPI0007AF06F0